MIKEFEGKTEKDAIQKAVSELGLTQDQFEVEILSAEKSGFLFKKGAVRIRAHFDDSQFTFKDDRPDLEPENDVEQKLIDFTTNVIKNMGYEAVVTLKEREQEKLIFSIESENSAIIIGRKGKNIDALQLLVNVYESRIAGGKSQNRIILDAENYRRRREENLIKVAEKTAESVVKSKSSKLLEPMNPFERRLIHTTLNDRNDVMTKSEGDGLFKRVRIIYKGSR
ncbi:MAG: protein jag [Spirochaetales bacterium]|nr:protein jag [Spirochaetales bacterium]